MLRQVRTYATSTVSSSRPPLQDILPSKRTLQRLLFDYDARLNYRKYIPTITKIYEHMDSPDLITVPHNVKGGDLMLFRNVLKEIRTKTHTINKNLVRLENELVEYSAELGDNNAVSILAFDCLQNQDSNTQEDIEHAKQLIKQLHQLKHPLTLKLSGDLAYKANDLKNTIKSYNEFLEIENDTMLLAEVYQSLGLIYFNDEKDLNKLEYQFQKAIKLTTIDKLSFSYFHLGLIYEDDPKLSRYYFEMAASQGLLESFANLGFLELNVFANAVKLIEWFKLGVELGDYNCLIGLFDSYISLKDYDTAAKTYDSIKLMIERRQVMTLDHFHEIRLNSLQILNDHITKKFNTTTTKSDRWNL